MLASFDYIWTNVFVWLHCGNTRSVKQKLSIISNLSSTQHANDIISFWCMLKSAENTWKKQTLFIYILHYL